MSNILIIRQLGLKPYEEVLLAMRFFTDKRNIDSADEIWLVQHPQVFTQGQFSKGKHLLKPSIIPVIQSDRGGQITFHGPGQQIMYVLLNIRRSKIKVQELITLLEQTIIGTLKKFFISSHTCDNLPGVYVNEKKICSLGLRVRKGCVFHGIALNVEMDLSPFLYINPCGHANLRMTQISDLTYGVKCKDVIPVLLEEFIKRLNVFQNREKILLNTSYLNNDSI